MKGRKDVAWNEMEDAEIPHNEQPTRQFCKTVTRTCPLGGQNGTKWNVTKNFSANKKLVSWVMLMSSTIIRCMFIRLSHHEYTRPSPLRNTPPPQQITAIRYWIYFPFADRQGFLYYYVFLLDFRSN